MAVVATLAVASLAVVLALVAAGGPGDSAVPAEPWSVGARVVVANLHVVRCPTSYGAPAGGRVRLPRFERAQVTRALAPTLSVFTDGLGTLVVLAPSGWSCTALDGVAGSSTLAVYPPGTAASGSSTTVGTGIVASQTGGCRGCALETACALFAGARRAYVAAYRFPCRGVGNDAELRTEVSGSEVLFVDPPHVTGAGRPSGGDLVAYGAMLWRPPGARQPSAWLDTCTLPGADHALCVLSIRSFLSRHPAAGSASLATSGPVTTPAAR